MRARFHHSIAARIKAFFTGTDLCHGPINGKGGNLRGYVSQIAHSPVFGMDVVDGHWWAHTARGWWPLSWYQEEAKRELIPIDPVVLAQLEATE